MQNFAASTVASTRPIDMRRVVGQHISVQRSTPYNDGNDCGELQFKNAAHGRPGHDFPIDGNGHVILDKFVQPMLTLEPTI